jgi:hypothetical protein
VQYGVQLVGHQAAGSMSDEIEYRQTSHWRADGGPLVCMQRNRYLRVMSLHNCPTSLAKLTFRYHIQLVHRNCNETISQLTIHRLCPALATASHSSRPPTILLKLILFFKM